MVDTDAIDKLLEEYASKNQLRVPIIRIDHSKYLFGTKVIVADIHSEVGLTVRVGGGFMTMREFVTKHQEREIAKLKQLVKREEREPLQVMQAIADKYKEKR